MSSQTNNPKFIISFFKTNKNRNQAVLKQRHKRKQPKLHPKPHDDTKQNTHSSWNNNKSSTYQGESSCAAENWIEKKKSKIKPGVRRRLQRCKDASEGLETASKRGERASERGATGPAMMKGEGQEGRVSVWREMEVGELIVER
jgi:hypothetical protein